MNSNSQLNNMEDRTFHSPSARLDPDISFKNGERFTKVSYRVIQYRKDGSKVENRHGFYWEVTKYEKEFYEKEMPRRAKITGTGHTWKFEKIKPRIRRSISI